MYNSHAAQMQYFLNQSNNPAHVGAGIGAFVQYPKLPRIQPGTSVAASAMNPTQRQAAMAKVQNAANVANIRQNMLSIPTHVDQITPPVARSSLQAPRQEESQDPRSGFEDAALSTLLAIEAEALSKYKEYEEKVAKVTQSPASLQVKDAEGLSRWTVRLAEARKNVKIRWEFLKTTALPPISFPEGFATTASSSAVTFYDPRVTLNTSLATGMTSSLSVISIAHLPRAVRLLAFDNWQAYLNLVFMTEDFIYSDDAKHLRLWQNVLEHPNKKWKERQEHDLSEYEWFMALKHVLTLMEITAPAAHVLWLEIYNTHLFNDPPSFTRRSYQITRQYDELLRSNCVPHGVAIPSWDYKELWEMAERIVDRREKRLVDAKPTAPAWAMTRSISSSKDPARLSDASFSSFSPPTLDLAEGGASSATNHQVSHAPNHQERCWICACFSHPSKSCASTKQVSGRPLSIVRNAKREWTFRNGKVVCYSYNKIRGCTQRVVGDGCEGRRHACSLCGMMGHGAQTCQT